MKVTTLFLLPTLLFLVPSLSLATGTPPQGIGLFITDTRQACWQMDNIAFKPTWKGNEGDPPCCIGPRCGGKCGGKEVLEPSTSTLSETLDYIENAMEATYVIIKIAENIGEAPQVDEITTAAFASHPGLKVYGYHKLGNSPGDQQANAAIGVFKKWPDLQGLVIIPGDAFYNDFDSTDTVRHNTAVQIARDYVDTTTAVLSAVYAGKCIVYSPRRGDSQTTSNNIFLPIADGIMPRTFWHKDTPAGSKSDPLGDVVKKEADFRTGWGKKANDAGPWWQGKPIILWAQTDMMENKGEKDRIKNFVKLVKDNTKSGGDTDYINLQGIAVWEFAHMNRKEIQKFDEAVNNWAN